MGTIVTSLKCTASSGNTDSGMISYDLSADHSHRFALRGIDFSRHNTRTALRWLRDESTQAHSQEYWFLQDRNAGHWQDIGYHLQSSLDCMLTCWERRRLQWLHRGQQGLQTGIRSSCKESLPCSVRSRTSHQLFWIFVLQFWRQTLFLCWFPNRISFRPRRFTVPTAVPPCARSLNRGNVDSTRSIPYLICWAYPENSCPSVKGVASCKCVRPILMIFAKSFDFLSNALCKVCKLGMRCLVNARTAAICMIVGKESLDDWDMLTWSFGWTGSLDPSLPPRRDIARLEITSLTFMWNCVPDPVCQTTRGKWSFNLPSATSLAAVWIASDILLSRPYCYQLI